MAAVSGIARGAVQEKRLDWEGEAWPPSSLVSKEAREVVVEGTVRKTYTLQVRNARKLVGRLAQAATGDVSREMYAVSVLTSKFSSEAKDVNAFLASIPAFHAAVNGGKSPAQHVTTSEPPPRCCIKAPTDIENTKFCSQCGALRDANANRELVLWGTRTFVGELRAQLDMPEEPLLPGAVAKFRLEPGTLLIKAVELVKQGVATANERATARMTREHLEQFGAKAKVTDKFAAKGQDNDEVDEDEWD